MEFSLGKSVLIVATGQAATVIGYQTTFRDPDQFLVEWTDGAGSVMQAWYLPEDLQAN